MSHPVQRVLAADLLSQPGAGAELVSPAAIAHMTQGHLLDEADVQAPLTGEVDQVQHFVLVAPLEDHGIDLDPCKARLAGGVNPGQHFLEPAMAGNGREPLWAQGVEADVQAPHPGGGQCIRLLADQCAIGGHHQFPQTGQGGDPPGQTEDPPAYQRLTPGETDLVHSQPGESPGHQLELFQREDPAAGQKMHLLRHAVEAAQVAAVGHRHPQVANAAAKAVLKPGRKGDRVSGELRSPGRHDPFTRSQDADLSQGEEGPLVRRALPKFGGYDIGGEDGGWQKFSVYDIGVEEGGRQRMLRLVQGEGAPAGVLAGFLAGSPASSRPGNGSDVPGCVCRRPVRLKGLGLIHSVAPGHRCRCFSGQRLVNRRRLVSGCQVVGGAME